MPRSASAPDGAWWVAQWLAMLGVLALPVLSLSVHRGANTAYFILLLAAALGAVAVAWRARAPGATALMPFWRDNLGLALAMTAPLLAVLISQAWLADFNGRPYDGRSRFLLALPIAWWLYQVPRQRLQAWAWATALGAVLATWVMWQAIPPHDTRPEPGFATAITFGNLTLLLGLFALLSLPWRLTRSWWETGLKVVAGLVGIYGSFLSQSRGGWLALPVIMGVLILVVRISWRWKLAAVVLTLAGVGTTYLASPLVQQRVDLAVAELHDYRQGQNLESSIGMRMQFWRASWDMFRQNPLSGVGSQHINAEYRQRVEAGSMAPAAATYNHSHNEVLWFMASWGLPGLLALLAVYLVPFVTFVRAARAADDQRAVAGRMGVALVTGYAVFGLTEAMFAITMNVAFYAGTVAILLALARPAGPAGGRPNTASSSQGAA